MKKLLYLTIVAVAILLSGACDDDEDIIDQLQKDQIIGKWSIVKEESTKGTEAMKTYTYDKNMVTAEFKENGDFQFINVDRMEVGKGSFAILTEEMKMSVTHMEGTETKVDTIVFESISATAAVFKMEGVRDGSAYINKMYLEKNDGSEAKIAAADLNGQWNFSAHTITGYKYEDREVGEQLWQRAMPSLPAARSSFTVTNSSTYFFIDTWGLSDVDKGTIEVLDESNIYIKGDGEDDENQLLHVYSNESGVISIKVMHVEREEVDGTEIDVKYVSEITMSKDDGTGFTMTETDLKTTWVFTDSEVYIDGTLDPEKTAGPQLNSEITFKADGVAELLEPESTTPDIMKYSFHNDKYLVLISKRTEGNETIEDEIIIFLDSYDTENSVLTIKIGQYDEKEGMNGGYTEVHKEEIIKLTKKQ